jgi:dTDP-glucose 4,6-dehydratase
MQNIEVVKTICALLDERRPRDDGKPRESQITYVKDRPGHDRRYALDTSKLRAMGWAPTVDFDEGLEATVAWYRDSRPWWEPIKSGEYAEWYAKNYAAR